ncbi:MAG: hypothetical protein AAF514_12930, partial [Verrucomicrobiota bacterium]
MKPYHRIILVALLLALLPENPATAQVPGSDDGLVPFDRALRGVRKVLATAEPSRLNVHATSIALPAAQIAPLFTKMRPGSAYDSRLFEELMDRVDRGEARLDGLASNVVGRQEGGLYSGTSREFYSLQETDSVLMTGEGFRLFPRTMEKRSVGLNLQTIGSASPDGSIVLGTDLLMSLQEPRFKKWKVSLDLDADKDPGALSRAEFASLSWTGNLVL